MHGAATVARLLNRDVKRREAFRPFAPAVLAEEAHKWFDGLTVIVIDSYFAANSVAGSFASVGFKGQSPYLSTQALFSPDTPNPMSVWL